MKKLLLFLLLCSGFVQAQIVNIPDSYFKANLLAADPTSNIAYSGGNKVKIDTNNDYQIQVSEALVIDSLRVTYGNITNLTGIAAFSNLKMLDCSENNLAALDITAIAGLKILKCSNNQLTAIDISQSPNLTELDCQHNQIASLDFSNSGNLKSLVCNDNVFTSFNFTGLDSIEYIDCTSNMLGTLDAGMLGTLKQLHCNYCGLANLNVTGLSGLEWLFCVGNPLGTINPAGLSGLKYFACASCELTSLDLTGLVSLIELNCTHNQLSTLDVSVIPNLDSLFCDYNQIVSIDFSASANLHQFGATYNLFTDIDFSQCPNLLGAGVGHNPQLTTVNLKNGTFQGNDFWQDTALAFICADESEIESIQATLSDAEITGVVVNSYCSFTPGGNFNTINGNVTFDGNNNGCEASDPKFPSMKMQINDGTTTGYTFTDDLGNYGFYTAGGNFTITPDMENLAAFTITPASDAVAFADSNNNTSERNFCLAPNGNHADVEVVIIPLIPARPGFNAVYKLLYRNKGNQLLSGSISFMYQDAVLDFVSSGIIPDSQDTNSLVWNYTNLLPFESRDFMLTFHVNSPTDAPAVNIGDELNFAAIINPTAGDESPLDNTFALKQVVVGSYDPNDKTCMQGNVVSPTMIGEYLHYVINFENTGTAPAENVVIKDLIDSNKFDINSLQVLGASHSEVPVITGSKVEFQFQNIDLAPNEYGYVAFKIKTKSNLAVGTTVTNKANIYFDFNLPVITNTASTTFQSLGIGEHAFDNSITVYPNPASHSVNVKSDSVIKSVNIFDIQGRIVAIQLVGENTTNLDISSYAPGIYYLKIVTDKGMKTEKLIKK